VSTESAAGCGEISRRLPTLSLTVITPWRYSGLTGAADRDAERRMWRVSAAHSSSRSREPAVVCSTGRSTGAFVEAKWSGEAHARAARDRGGPVNRRCWRCRVRSARLDEYPRIDDSSVL